MFKFIPYLVIVGIGASAVGCKNANCVELCSDAQRDDCTSITGDCGDFCDALDNIKEPSGCEDRADAYQDCLNDGDNVCDNDCSGTEGDLSTCVATYCFLHATDEDCQTLVESF